MTRLRGFGAWLRALRPGRRIDLELEEELESHISLHIDDNLRAGLPLEEARRRALMRLGGINGIREAHRDTRLFAAIASLTRDVRHGLRLMRRQPLFNAIAVLSLALGIGANAAIFSIVDRLMLRPLPVHEPERLAIVREPVVLSYPIWEELDRASPAVGQMAAWALAGRALSVQADGRTSRDRGAIVSGGFFEVLGVKAARGRALRRDDDRRGGGEDGAVAVISDQYRTTRFGGADDVVGRRVDIERVPFTIVGVMPAGFFGVEVGDTFDVAVPFGTEPLLKGTGSQLDERGSWWVSALVRLPDGQTLDRATAALHTLQPQIRVATLPSGRSLERHFATPLLLESAATGTSFLREQYRLSLGVLAGTAAIVLLITCVNLATLLLARAAARRAEMSLRRALGAPRRRLVAQVLTESLMLAVAGGALGLLVARAVAGLAVRHISTSWSPVVLDLSTDWRMLAFTAATACGTAVLFGVVPALRASRVDPHTDLISQVRTVGGERSVVLSSSLLAVQVALSLVLVVAAGLFLRTFAALAWQSPGFDHDHVVVAQVSFSPDVIRPAERVLLVERLRAAAARVPGVARTAASLGAPISRATSMLSLDEVDGVDVSSAADSSVVYIVSSEDYFATYGTPIAAGRDFSIDDAGTREPVAIVNEAFVRAFAPAADGVVGRTLRYGRGRDSIGTVRTIVGVARDAIYADGRTGAVPIVYLPLRQREELPWFTSISIRAAGGDAVRMVPALSTALQAVDDRVTFTLTPLATSVENTLARERTVAMLASGFGVLAVGLSAIGLYGVVAYATSRRRWELGVRAAVGATPRALVRLVTSRVAAALLVGVALGAVAALWVARFVQPLLYGLKPNDPATFAASTLVLLVTGAVAAVIPAWRAARTDAATVLREP